jgi:hypothetical protein
MVSMPNLRRLPCGSFLAFFTATFFVVCLQMPPVACAQSELAGVYGRVTDASGAVIAEVEVEIKNVETNASALTKTNQEGLYTIPSLRPGHYLIFARKPGFKTVTVTGLDLNVQDNIIRNFTLPVGSVSESVTVTGGAPLLNTTDATVGTVVDRQFVENMPLNGRSLQSLIALTPGVMTAKPYDQSPGQFSVNGQRVDANYFSIDGASANIGIGQGGDASFIGPASGPGALPALSVGGGTNSLVSIDAMQEFKIQTSTFSPEFGRTPGAQISIVTRSGTNSFHGTAFDYFRNDVLDARDWFTNYNNLPKPKERQNDFGGVFGGPIVKNRLFFFFSYEGLRLILPRTKTEIEPSTAARSQAPANIQPLLNAFPVPNVSDGPLTGVFAGSYSNPSTLNATSIRVDSALTSKISLFGRYNHAPSSGNTRGTFDFYSLSTVQHIISNVDTFTVGATVTFKPNLLNDFRLNISRALGGSDFTADNFGGAVVPPDSYVYGSYPGGNSKIDNFYVLLLPDVNGYYSGGSYRFHQRQLNMVDTIAWTLGSHSLKAGFDYRRLTPIPSNFPYQYGVYFTGVSGAVAGTTSLASAATSQMSSLRLLLQNFSFFAQDTWQATPNLTLTYGLRWDYNSPPSEMTGHPLYAATNFTNPANATLGTTLWNPTHDNFAPRLGIAYRLRRTPGHEMVMRAGAGTFYDLGNNRGTDSENYFPYSQIRYSFSGEFPLTSADATPPPISLNPPYGATKGFGPNLRLPRTYEWNLSLQQSLGSNQSLTATYLGAAGRKLLREEGIVEGLNPNFSTLLVTTNDAYSNYNALQLQYQRRLSRGLQVLASYAWSHALDNTSSQDVSSVAPYHLVYNPDWDYGHSDFDVRHSFSTAITYNLPSPEKSRLLQTIVGNWALDSLFRANTAIPVNILSGLDPFGLLAHGYSFTTAYGRPDVVPNQPFYLYGSQYPGGKAFNPAAFQDPISPTAQGNLARNALRGFGAWEENLAIRREFPIHEQLKLQFRAEMFNIFNHPNFGDPGVLFNTTNVLTSPLFGRSTMTLAQSLYSGAGSGGFSALYQTGGPRSIQLALKLMF